LLSFDTSSNTEGAVLGTPPNGAQPARVRPREEAQARGRVGATFLSRPQAYIIHERSTSPSYAALAVENS